MSTPSYNPAVPIYLQLKDTLRQKIFLQQWAPGDKIPAVRELALTFAVNPNTVQRALTELEHEGLFYSERTAGRFVTTDTDAIETARRETARGTVSKFVWDMKQLGYNQQSAIQAVSESWSI